MALYLLYESSSGYALLHAQGLDEIGQNTEAVRNSVADLNRFGKVVQLIAFQPFESAIDGLNQCNSVSEGITRAYLFLCFVFQASWFCLAIVLSNILLLFGFYVFFFPAGLCASSSC